MLSLYNGKIRSGGDFYEAIAIEDGSIAALGTNEEIRSFAANAGCSAAGGECGGAEPGHRTIAKLTSRAISCCRDSSIHTHTARCPWRSS